MPFDTSRAASGRDAPGPDRDDADEPDSLIPEIRAAADAAVSEICNVAATASAEARLSVASAIAMASATMLGVALVIVAWTCIVALGVWLAIVAGWSVAAALLTAALANIVAACLSRVWYARLSGNIGFARTFSLLSGSGTRRRERSR